MAQVYYQILVGVLCYLVLFLKKISDKGEEKIVKMLEYIIM